MKAQVVYDSVFGNTEKIARAIGEGFAENVEATDVLSTKEASYDDLKELDFLVTGAPTHGGRPSPNMKEFLDGIPDSSLNNLTVVAFDTRSEGENNSIPVRIITRILGYAAGRIAKALEAKGGKSGGEPQGFRVAGREGPLEEGELDRARNWGKELSNLATN